MEINGRQIGLFFSVGAKYEIGSLDQGMDKFRRAVETALIMSKAYETAKALKDPEYKPRPLKREEVMTLTDEEFGQLCDEIAAVFTAGKKTTVEAEQSKKKIEAST